MMATSDIPDVFIESRELDQASKARGTLFPNKLIQALVAVGHTYRVVRLDYSDYLLPHVKRVIERKTFADFVSSWQRGDRTGKERLFEQIKGCRDHYGENAESITLLIDDGLRVIPDAQNDCLWYIPLPDESHPDPIRLKKSEKG